MDLERHDPGPEPGIRASDAERDRVVGLLKQHFTDGRLTLEEFSERMDLAYQARTRGQLVSTLRELPVLAQRVSRTVERPRRAFEGGYRWAFPAPLVPIGIVALLVVLAVMTRGLILWPLFMVMWIWGGHHARHGHGHRHWHRRHWHRHRIY